MGRPIIDTIIDFVTSIGLEVVKRPITKDTFLPGLLLENGKIVVDTDKLLYPGDILHEAGHLAAYDAETRKTIGDPLPEFMSDGFEVMALGWSYAACLHIDHPKAITSNPSLMNSGNGSPIVLRVSAS